MVVERAVKDFHALISRNRSMALESAEILTEAQLKRGLVYGDRPLCPFLRPFFLAREEYVRIQEVVKLLQPAFDLLVSRALADPRWQQWMGMSELEQQFFRYDPGFKAATVTSRLDAFFTPSSFKFVEYNAECPTGIGYGDVMAEIWRELPVFREFKKLHKVKFIPARQTLLSSLLDTYKRWGGRNRPNVAIVDWADVPTRTEFEIHRDYFAARGLKTIICDPRHLELRKGKLYHEDFRIDLIYRRVLVHEFLDKLSECLPMAEAYRTGRVCVVNSFRTKILHKKAVFAALHEDEVTNSLKPESRAAILEHIPWTRKVEDRRVTLNGKRIELLPYIEGNRRKLVLKPNDDYGGRGIVIGWETEQDDWNMAIRRAMEGGYVVQHRVEFRRESFPDIRENLRLRQMTVDMDPFVFAGKGVVGVLTRLASSALVNVTRGGGQVPTFVVE